MTRYAILEAPSNLGLKPTGVEELAATLLELGLGRRIGARYAGRVEAPAFNPLRDLQTRMLNPDGIASYSISLANAVGPIIESGEFPVVLGGDCSILLGNMLALRRRGRYGLFFLDGHADFWMPEKEPNGEAASMDLALATGWGPSLVTDLEGLRPLVRIEDVIAFGMRDGDLDNDYRALGGGSAIPPELYMTTLGDIRKAGFQRPVAALAQSFASLGPDGFWIHLDVDVLDDAIMPAVDYRMPGGLGWAELVACLKTALLSGRAIGLEVTIYNPKLDPGLAAGRGLVEALVTGLL